MAATTLVNCGNCTFVYSIVFAHRQLQGFLQRNNSSALIAAGDSGSDSAALYSSVNYLIMELDEVKRENQEFKV